MQRTDRPEGRGELVAGGRGVSGEDDLHDLLTGAEAVVGDAAAEPGLGQHRVHRAPVVGLQVGARLVRRLVDREVRRPGEAEGDAAQTHARAAVGEQVLRHGAQSAALVTQPTTGGRFGPVVPGTATGDLAGDHSRHRERGPA